VSIVVRNDIVAREVDSVGTSDFKENALVLGDGDVKRLLVILGYR
jgi:hypothetical protein